MTTQEELKGKAEAAKERALESLKGFLKPSIPDWGAPNDSEALLMINAIIKAAILEMKLEQE